MIKPERLRKGDKVAIVSLSSGMLGEKQYLHKYELGKKRKSKNIDNKKITLLESIVK